MAAGSGRGLHLSRRTFVGGVLASSMLPLGVRAADRGASGDPSIEAVVRSMEGVGGDRTASIQILVSPGCDKGSDLLTIVESFDGIDVRWVPFGWTESDDVEVQGLLQAGVGSLGSYLRGSFPSAGASNIDTARRQRSTFDESLFMPLARATGRTPATPTVVVFVGGEVRVYRGAPDRTVMRDIAAMTGHFDLILPEGGLPEAHP